MLVDHLGSDLFNLLVVYFQLHLLFRLLSHACIAFVFEWGQYHFVVSLVQLHVLRNEIVNGLAILHLLLPGLLLVFADVRDDLWEMLSQFADDREVSELCWHLSVSVELVDVEYVASSFTEALQKL